MICCQAQVLFLFCKFKKSGWWISVFIRRKGDPERAETFFQEALKSYVSEGWSLPVTHTRKQIAECQKLLGRTEEYLSKQQCHMGHLQLFKGQICQLSSGAESLTRGNNCHPGCKIGLYAFCFYTRKIGGRLRCYLIKTCTLCSKNIHIFLLWYWKIKI